MDIKKILASIDDDVLEEIISGCEGKMGEPFAKKEETALPPTTDESAEGDEMSASDDEINPDELEELLRTYEG